MNYSIDIAEAAENDIAEIFLYYHTQKDSVGDSFKNIINQAVDSIQSNPLKTQVRYGSTRVFFLKKFQFGIHFQVNEYKQTILIVAVFHTSSDPKKWADRT